MLVVWLPVISRRSKTIKQLFCTYTNSSSLFLISLCNSLLNMFFLPLSAPVYYNLSCIPSSSISVNRKPVNMNKTPITYRQEKSHMGSMERSFTDQSTLQEDERMALSFMDAHTCGTRSMTNAHTDSQIVQFAQTHELTTATPDCNLLRHLFTPQMSESFWKNSYYPVWKVLLGTTYPRLFMASRWNSKNLTILQKREVSTRVKEVNSCQNIYSWTPF